MAPLGGLPYGIDMPRSGRGAAVALAAVAVLALSACTAPANSGPVTPPSASASPRATAVFGSDEEALAAATAAYSAYLAMSDQIAQEGGRNPERMRQVASGQALRAELDGFREFSLAGARSVGSTTARGHRLQRVEAGAQAAILIYVCDDVSGVDVRDAAGRSLVAPNRPSVTPFEVRLVSASPNGDLVVDSKTVWEGTDFC